MNKRLLSITEAAEYLSIKKWTLYAWVSQKRIPHVKMGRRTMFDSKELDNFIERNSVCERNVQTTQN